MAWVPGVLNSARKQWFQRTFAVLPQGNWHARSQSLCILDNGEVWVYMVVPSSYFNSYPFSGFDSFGQVELTWIGKVSPEGCVRVSGDEFVYGGAIDGYMDAWGYEVPRPEDTYLPHTGWGYSAGNSIMVTDGQYLYIYFNWEFDLGGRHSSWYKLDPVTYNFERMAGTYFEDPEVTNDAPRDAAIGLDATFGRVGQPAYLDGWLYFPDIVERVSGSNFTPRKSIRRISTTAPYPVETVVSYPSPAGAPADTDVGFQAWASAVNPVTGIPNFFNDDALFYYDNNDLYMPMVIWEDYFYVLACGTGAANDITALTSIRRIPLAGGPVETLFYGIGYGGFTANQVDRDDMNDSEPWPNGKLHSFLPNHYESIVNGTPDYEGFDPNAFSSAVGLNGELFYANWPGSWFTGGQQWGMRIVKFDIPELVAKFEADGPQRVNRADPQWDTINGGTAFMEQALMGNNGVLYRDRLWFTRDGSTPLMTHALTPGMATNNVHPDWVGKFAFIQPAISDSVAPLNLSPSGIKLAMMVSVLSEDQAGDMQVRLYFDGIALKAYVAGPGLVPAYAPVEVILT